MTATLIKKLNININIRYMTSTITTTTTSTTTTTENNDYVKAQDTVFDVEETKISQQSTPTTQEILNKIEDNKKIYEDVINKTKKSVDDISAQINIQDSSSPSTQKTERFDIESTITTSADIENTYKQLEGEIQYPKIVIPTDQERTVTVEDAVAPIIASCKLTAEALANKMVENGILLEESEKAEIRQEALYIRIKEFVDSFGIAKTALKIGGGIALIYTIYNLIRYRQLPLGGFIKGLFTSTGGIASETTSNIVNPTNNITINMPSLDTIKQNIPLPASSTSLGTFIDQLGPTGLVMLGGIIWILKKIK